MSRYDHWLTTGHSDHPNSPDYDERADEADAERRATFQDALICCADFIAEQSTANDEEAAALAEAVNAADHAKIGQLFVALLYRQASEQIEDRADSAGLTFGEAAERLFEVYRPEPVRAAA